MEKPFPSEPPRSSTPLSAILISATGLQGLQRDKHMLEPPSRCQRLADAEPWATVTELAHHGHSHIRPRDADRRGERKRGRNRPAIGGSTVSINVRFRCSRDCVNGGTYRRQHQSRSDGGHGRESRPPSRTSRRYRKRDVERAWSLDDNCMSTSAHEFEEKRSRSYRRNSRNTLQNQDHHQIATHPRQASFLPTAGPNSRWEPVLQQLRHGKTVPWRAASIFNGCQRRKQPQ